MIYVMGLAIVAAIVYGIVKFASGERYFKMTEEEFEAEAKRTSLMGAAVAGLQKTIDPSHGVQYVQEQQQRMEADGAESGEKPEAGAEKKDS
jgi:hypothetical protein